ncbi:hypothetical protein DH2020_024307 [Rehmannia glutinosa]|uniref:Uncharacterized protein n=1 Tax=Rehmannia glutinosa TaxID=99300 RepID=A0ABR0W6Q9_REHGL
MWDLYIWIPKSYGTILKVNKAPVDQTKVLNHGLGMESAEKPNAVLSKLFSGKLLENFTVDNSTYSLAQVRATCYPKFENEKSDQEKLPFLSPILTAPHTLLELSPDHARNQRRGSSKEHRWVEKPKSDSPSTSLLASAGSSSATTEDLTNRLNTLSVAESKEQSVVPVPSLQFGSIGLANHARGQKSIWKPKSYGTISEATAVKVDKAPVDQTKVLDHGPETESAQKPKSAEKPNAVLSKLFSGKLLENFTVDNSTYSLAQVRATFYPKFENEKSDQEVRTRMIEMVTKGLATLEVSLKHSGSLFMYAGHEGGAYAKNSYGNIYTAVGVFVLGRMFREAWGSQSTKKQAEFNDFLERNRMCISMELVTAVLGDHGQRPREDYVVVTAVTELGCGKPKFYSTPDVIAFCRKWRLPTNHVWLLSTRAIRTVYAHHLFLGIGSTSNEPIYFGFSQLLFQLLCAQSPKKSVTSFFAAYDALCEEGTATSVCKALDEVADISVPGSKDHIKVQGEILEGLVARIVSPDSSEHMEQVLRDYPPPQLEGADLGSSLREICAANRTDEKQQIKALLESVGTSFCPNYLDWFGNEASDGHSRNADRSVLSKFLQARPADYSTTKLQEMVRLMREKRFPAAFKCYHNFHKIDSLTSDDLHFKMVIHVHSDSAFRRYQKEMRYNPGLWPLYRGVAFYLTIGSSKTWTIVQLLILSETFTEEDVGSVIQFGYAKFGNENVNELYKNCVRYLLSQGGVYLRDLRAAEFTKETDVGSGTNGATAKEGLADEDANLMIKLKFLTYKLKVMHTDCLTKTLLFVKQDAQIKTWHSAENYLTVFISMLRTFLIRNGLSILFKQGEAAYKAYYLRQMQKWNTSAAKQRELSKMLDEWAVFIRRKYGHKQLSSSTYLSEAEPFLEQYAKRSPQNQVLIGSAGSLVRSEDFMAIIDGGRDEEGDLEQERDIIPSRIPGCAKSALCKEILSTPGALGDDRPVHSLMGDLIKDYLAIAVVYSQVSLLITLLTIFVFSYGSLYRELVVAEERRKKPYSILLADKNAPNEEVWRQIEDMCRSTKASAVPVVPDSEGTESNPFSLDALAVFIFRVLGRVNHPGNLDKSSPNAGYVLLMFYHLYDGKNRNEFEAELIERFGSLVKMPLLNPTDACLSYYLVFAEDLRHFLSLSACEDLLYLNVSEPTKGTYAKEWAKWEKQLRETLLGNAEYLNSIQVPFESSSKVFSNNLKQLRRENIQHPVLKNASSELGEKDPRVEGFLKDKNLKSSFTKAHLTLAHKRSHGVTAVASYGPYVHQNVPVDMVALLFSDKLAAFEAEPGWSMAKN